MTFVFRRGSTLWIQGLAYSVEALSNEVAVELYKAALKDPTQRLVDCEDIAAFSTVGAGRQDNDRLNATRERILAASQHVPPAFFEDAARGPSWKEVLTQWDRCLASCCTPGVPYTYANITWMGGRKNKYDFGITYMDADGTPVGSAALEYKHNAKSLYALPQFLSIPAKPGVFLTNLDQPESTQGYAEFFYDRFLPRYMACDPDIGVGVPERSVYLQHVYKSDEACHPFFAALRSREGVAKTAKAAVVHQSIAVYLAGITADGAEDSPWVEQARFDVPAFVARIRETQKDKHFALWSPRGGGFTVEHLNMTDAVWSSAVFGGVKGGNTVIVDLPADPERRAFHALLRWRNHLGILNPAWQIKVVRRRNPAVH